VRVALLTREYPPEVYGGAGVHVEYLARELARLEQLTVHCWGAPRDAPGVVAHRAWDALVGPEPHLAALQAMSIDLAMAARTQGAELVHSHTWYANLAGHLAKLTYGIPHVATVHSLEPLRPWKAE
jgi:starch synthase